MTKNDIAVELCKRIPDLPKSTALHVVDGVTDILSDAFDRGENVYLRGFGSFIVKQRAEKTARNISKNTTIIIPAHNIPAFKPAAEFKKEVAK